MAKQLIIIIQENKLYLHDQCVCCVMKLNRVRKDDCDEDYKLH